MGQEEIREVERLIGVQAQVRKRGDEPGNEKEKYRGGELLIESLNSESKFKLDAGGIIIYPSTYLHSVLEVLCGERLCTET